MKVKKRDGSLKPFNFEQIEKQIKPACKGLKNIDYKLLEERIKMPISSGISTEEIHKIVLRTALDFIDVDAPDWTYVAARLNMYDLYHRIKKYYGVSKSGDVYKLVPLNIYLDRAKELDLVSDFYKKFTDEDLKKLNKAIDMERDLLFDYLGSETAKTRYIMKDGNHNPIELPQYLHMSVAMYLMQNEKEYLRYTKEYYDATSEFYIVNATPINTYGRLKDGSTISCLVNSIPDYLEGIFDKYKEIGNGSAQGSGWGQDWSWVRSKGSYIDGKKGVAGGKIPFLKIDNDISISVDQKSQRPGAFEVTINAWDVDIFDFIDLKKKNGEERRRARELFLGINIEDFMFERWDSDEEETMTLFDPYDVPELKPLYGEEFTKRYEEYEKEFLDDPSRFNDNTEVIYVNDLFKYFIASMGAEGMPFIHFIGNSNRANPHKELGKIHSFNLCVTGDTKILTKDYGNTEIGKLVESGVDEAECWNGEEWSKTKLFRTDDGSGQEVMEVKLSNGTIIEATPYHKWYIINDDHNEECVRTNELMKGDAIIKFELPVSKGKTDNEWLKIDTVTLSGITVLDVTSSGKVAATYCGTEPKRHKLIFNGVLTGNCTEVLQPTDPDHTTVCNLGSLNLARILKGGFTNENKKKLVYYTKLLQRALDNSIDLTNYPSEESRRTQLERRSTGIGTVGEAELMANEGISYGTKKHQEVLDWIWSTIDAASREASKELAKEKGSCIIDGERNAYRLAVAPNSTSGSFIGTTNSHEQAFDKIWLEENLLGTFHMVAPNLNVNNIAYYTSPYETDTMDLIDSNAVRTKHVDQGISFNIYEDTSKVKLKASNVKKFLIHAWKKGIKSTYYVRTRAPKNKEEALEQKKTEINCVGCKN